MVKNEELKKGESEEKVGESQEVPLKDAEEKVNEIKIEKKEEIGSAVEDYTVETESTDNLTSKEKKEVAGINNKIKKTGDEGKKNIDKEATESKPEDREKKPEEISETKKITEEEKQKEEKQEEMTEGGYSEKVKVPFMITRDMKQQLHDLGYSKKDIKKMKPEKACEILGVSLEAEETIEEEELEEGDDVKVEDKKAKKEKFLDDFNKKLRKLGESIEDFNDLSKGQQALVLENFQQLALSGVKEESQKKYKEDLGKSKLLGKIWKGVIKGYKISKLEKQESKELFKLDSETYKEVMKRLVQGIKENGPEVKLGEKGEMEIQYAGDWKALNEEEQGIVDNFNKIANEFSHMPYEWSLDTATKAQRRKFDDLKMKYEKSKKEIINIKKEKSKKREEKNKEEEALLYINSIEGKIQMNQFLSNNPEVEKELLNIKNKSVWGKVFKNVITERGIYMGAGYVVRSVSVSLAGAIALPAAAAFIGGWRANVRARKNLRESDINARKGIEDKSKQARNVAGLDEREVKYKGKKFISGKEVEIVTTRKGLIGKIDDLINKINSEKKKKIKIELLNKLNIRIQYTQRKIDEGLVNFGDEKSRLDNQYKLIKKISEAGIILHSNTEFTESKSGKEIEERLERYLDFKSRKIGKKRKKYIVKKTITGGVISAGFASAGYLIRHLVGGGGLKDLGKQGAIKDEISALKGEETSTIENILDNKSLSGEDKVNALREHIEELQTGAGKESVEIPEKDLPPIEDIPSVKETGEHLIPNQELYIDNEDMTPDAFDRMDAVYSKMNSEDKGDMFDMVKDAKSAAVIKPGEGVSQALGKIEDSDMQATIINPDGSKIQGDIHLAHTGDTVVQGKDGEIYIFKTSDVKVSSSDSLVKAWVKTIESKLDRKLTNEEIARFSGKDGKLDWQEAKNLHDEILAEVSGKGRIAEIDERVQFSKKRIETFNKLETGIRKEITEVDNEADKSFHNELKMRNLQDRRDELVKSYGEIEENLAEEQEIQKQLQDFKGSREEFNKLQLEADELAYENNEYIIGRLEEQEIEIDDEIQDEAKVVSFVKAAKNGNRYTTKSPEELDKMLEPVKKLKLEKENLGKEINGFKNQNKALQDRINEFKAQEIAEESIEIQEPVGNIEIKVKQFEEIKKVVTQGKIIKFPSDEPLKLKGNIKIEKLEFVKENLLNGEKSFKYYSPGADKVAGTVILKENIVDGKVVGVNVAEVTEAEEILDEDIGDGIVEGETGQIPPKIEEVEPVESATEKPEAQVKETIEPVESATEKPIEEVKPVGEEITEEPTEEVEEVKPVEKPEPVKEVGVEPKEEVITEEEVEPVIDSETTLKFGSHISEDQQIQIQKFYDYTVEKIDKMKEGLISWKERYGDKPNFELFKEKVESDINEMNHYVDKIAEDVQNPDIKISAYTKDLGSSAEDSANMTLDSIAGDAKLLSEEEAAEDAFSKMDDEMKEVGESVVEPKVQDEIVKPIGEEITEEPTKEVGLKGQVITKEEEIPGGKREFTEFDEPGRKGTLIEEHRESGEKGNKLIVDKSVSNVRLTGGRLMEVSSEKSNEIVNGLQDGSIDSKEDMIQKIQEIKEEITGNSELTNLERKSWELTYKSYERSPNSSSLVDNMKMDMISFLSKLREK